MKRFPLTEFLLDPGRSPFIRANPRSAFLVRLLKARTKNLERG
jgi:hypothetical protein